MTRMHWVILLSVLGAVGSFGLVSGHPNPTDWKASIDWETRWSEILEELYDEVQKSIGYCFGRSPQGLLDLISDSFQVPQQQLGEGVCANTTAVAANLCTPDDIQVYYKFMLLTQDPEKVPSTVDCPSVGTPECSPGFFGHKVQGDKIKASPCCDGFFCPRGLSCMVPCPQGAYCPRGVPALPPKAFRSGKHEEWCAPYAYKLKMECGGADQWTIIPQESFPGTDWKYGSGGIFCPKGFYCPNTMNMTICPRGYYCRQGAIAPIKCPPGAFCPEGTEVPLSNYGGFFADLFLLITASVLWLISQNYDSQNNKRGDSWIPSQPCAQERINDSLYVDLPSSIQNSEAEGDMNVDITFIHLQMRLKRETKNLFILTDVTGEFRNSSLTFILGPSGAGKSSLLSCLAGKVLNCRAHGRILINGTAGKLSHYKRIIGFVPQDDIMFSQLTVEENLLYAARFKMARGSSWLEHQMRTNDVIHLLGLESVRDQIVGDEQARGISGGQKKRVNIGIELVGSPKILFLDEPTSGLDASSAYSLTKYLQYIAHKKRVTTAAILHQPRHESFSLCDNLLLLASGRTAYFGSVACVEKYFENLGFPFPIHTNPADFIMDILSMEHIEWSLSDENSGLMPDTLGRFGIASVGGETLLGGSSEDELCIENDETLAGCRSHTNFITSLAFGCRAFIFGPMHRTFRNFLIGLRRRNHGLERGQVYEALLTQSNGAPTHPRAHRQYLWFLHRASLCRFREPLRALTEYSIVILTGITVGLLSDRGRSTIMSYASQISYCVVAMGLIGIISAIPTFTRYKLYFRRESSSGINKLSYFAALDTFDFVGSCIKSFVYLVAWASFASPRAQWWQLYLITTSLFYSCTGIAYTISLFLGETSSQLAAAIITLLQTLIAREPDPGFFMNILQSISFPRWAMEGFVIAESNQLKGVWLLARCADLKILGYDVRRFLTCVCCLFAIGVVCRLVAIYQLIRYTRTS